eukprot:SAG22_NODE_13380_length_409_cov_0.635484_1_plen_105_part_10
MVPGAANRRLASALSALSGQHPQPTAVAAASTGPPLPPLVPRRLTTKDLMFGGAPIGGGTDLDAAATVQACLRAGIRDYDTAPLYSDSEDKLGMSLRNASAESAG